MTRQAPQAVIGNLTVEVRKDWYTGLWNVYYLDAGKSKYAGPFKTKGEAVKVLQEDHD